MDGQSQTGKFIKNLHAHHEELLTQIDSVYNKISEVLQNKKKKVLKTLDERMVSIKEELKKDKNYFQEFFYKVKSKFCEQNEALKNYMNYKCIMVNIY